MSLSIYSKTLYQAAISTVRLVFNWMKGWHFFINTNIC